MADSYLDLDRDAPRLRELIPGTLVPKDASKYLVNIIAVYQRNNPPVYETDPDNLFRILLATDNHVGYNERDPIRGQDSMNTFKEILQLAVKHDASLPTFIFQLQLF